MKKIDEYIHTSLKIFFKNFKNKFIKNIFIFLDDIHLPIVQITE